MSKTSLTSKRGFGRTKSFKSDSSYRHQVTLTIKYVGATLASAGCPKDAIQSYLKTLRRRLLNEGNGFLKQLRGLFIQGVKTLGGDQPDFTGWSTKGGYPRLFRWVFQELEKAHNSESVDPKQVKLLLSVLYVSRSLKSELSPKQEDNVVNDFVDRVTIDDFNIVNHIPLSETVYRIICDNFRSQIQTVRKDFPFGAELDLSRRGQKPSSLWKGREHKIPELLAKVVKTPGIPSHPEAPALPAWNGFEGLPSFVDDGPLGKIVVLGERAGKSRVICAYNGFIHATDLYDRARSVLRSVTQDVSEDQKKGHNLAHILSMSDPKRRYKASLAFKPGRPTNVDLDALEGVRLVSADLTAFTDTIDPGAIEGALRALQANNLFPLITTGEVQLPDGNLITPRVALMGFKGCFEVASLVHHAMMHQFVGTDYAMCGDDVVGVFNPATYEEAVGSVGLKLNRSKTVISDDTCTFCGKVYFRGFDVSPFTPTFYNLVSSSFGIFTDAARSNLDLGYLAPAQFNELVRIVKSESSRFKKFVSYELPSKLGGIDCRLRKRSLTSILAEHAAFVVASNSVKREKDDRELKSRNPLPGVPVTGCKVLPWTNLYFKGGSSLPKKVKASVRKDRRLVGMYEILEYYYTSTAASQ